ncbi:MAG: twin-arginine translocase TatA/TatE family subunit, partial [Raoultibacter sp.]
MFGIGGFELVLILLFGFLIFGPDKLPAIAKTVGQAIAKFKNAQEEMNKVIKTEVYDPTSDEPFKNPLEALSKLEGDKKKEEKTESFSERKAKYDKERAAKKAAEEETAATAKTEEPAPDFNAVAAAIAASPAQKLAPNVGAKEGAMGVSATPGADELYGNKPSVKKPASSSKAATAPKPAAATKSAAASKPSTAKPATRRTATAKTTAATEATAAKPATRRTATTKASTTKTAATAKTAAAKPATRRTATAKTTTTTKAAGSAAAKPATK